MRTVALVLVMACAKAPVVPRPAPTTCVVSGTVAIAPFVQLLIGGVPRLRFRGSAVAIEAKITGEKNAAVVVRVSSLRFSGTMAVRDLPLRSARVIPIVKEHVWFESGVPLDVSPGPRVTSWYSQGLDITADVTCDALALTRETSGYKVKGTGYHLASDTVALYDAPNGTRLVELRPRSKNIFTVWVERVDRGYAHMVHRDWISVDGWVRQSELIAGEAGDCDDCRGEGIMDMEDRCPVENGEDDADGCPEEHPPLATISHATSILDDAGVSIGVAEKGAELFVLGRENGRARVLPSSTPVLPVGTAWWVAESAIGG